jgi:hypothetical protein
MSVLLLSAQAAAPPRLGTTTDDLQHRSPSIHWPDAFNPLRAGSFAHNAVIIYTGCSNVWSHLVDIPEWPKWLVLTPHAQWISPTSIPSVGAKFQWQILNYQEESEIKEFVPPERIGWTSYTPGQAPLYYHAWLLQPGAGGCRVVTEEVGTGADAARTAKAGDTETHRVHELWLASLRWLSGS